MSARRAVPKRAHTAVRSTEVSQQYARRAVLQRAHTAVRGMEVTQ